jgi:hypothetical protein
MTHCVTMHRFEKIDEFMLARDLPLMRPRAFSSVEKEAMWRRSSSGLFRRPTQSKLLDPKRYRSAQTRPVAVITGYVAQLSTWLH